MHTETSRTYSKREGPLMLPPATVEWGTPPELVQRYADRWAGGAFDLDAAASDALHVCPHYYTVHDDGLSLPWRGRVWVNPPYGLAEQKWVAKAIRETLAGRAECVVMLLPAKTGKIWFQRYVMSQPPGTSGVTRLGTCPLRYPCAAVDFVRGRVAHLMPDGSSGSVAAFASVVLLFRAWSLGPPAALGRLPAEVYEMDVNDLVEISKNYSTLDEEIRRAIDAILVGDGQDLPADTLDAAIEYLQQCLDAADAGDPDELVDSLDSAIVAAEALLRGV